MIIGIGGVNIDYKYALKTNNLYSSNEAVLKMSYGGVIRNVLENLGRLSLPVKLVSFVGNDTLGDQILEYSKEFMDVSLVKRTSDSTGTYTALSYENDLFIGVSSMNLSGMKAYLLSIEKELIQADFLVFESNLDKDTIRYLIELGNKYGIKTVLIGVSDPKMTNVPRELGGLYLAIHNKGESIAYHKQTVPLLELNALWKEKGVKHTIITDGKRQVAYNGYLIDVKENKNFKDPTGLGDAFSSGVIYGDSKGYTIEYACVIGMTNSYYTAETLETVRKDLNETTLKKEVKKYYD